MKIGGLQKLSLIDYPGKLSAVVFTFGCNFKCGFFHNPELVLPEKISFIDENSVLEFLLQRKKYLDCVCITGGEPLINKDIEDFLYKIKNLGLLIKIDTNGSNPELLKRLIERKLVDFTAMDIKSGKENYNIVTDEEIDVSKIEESIKIIANSGVEYELRTTVVPGIHSIDEVISIGEWVFSFLKKRAKRYVLQNFVPRENKMINKKLEKVESFDSKILENMKNAVEDYFEEVKIRS